MSLQSTTINEIKSIIRKFINENGFVKSEEDVQSSYTLKILELLGWDSSKWKINTTQEIKTGNKPDILLKGSSGGTIFIIESKAPKQSLDGKYFNKTFKEQICEYCNSEGIYWGVLTNFLEWRIYNSYRKEIYYDKKYFTICDNKINDDNELYNFFERIRYDNLNKIKGKIDTNPIYYKKQEEIRDEFFDNLKVWRHKLRTYLFPKFKKIVDDLQQETVEKITQSILDRLIFMEVCNDKGIISYDILGSILYSKRNKYEELKIKFKELDEKFNSELFAEDPIIDDLEIDDEPMEEIIRGINNIDFSKLSVHIIGEVYENYLGELLKKRKSEIKLVEREARVKRKEQGIYYTPDYIVNYIVENTLGEILKKCKTEEEIQKIRVLDPACGSGSFLIRAFDEFYKAYKNCKMTLVIFDDFEIKRKILLYNLYGVDLDERAVDIAKLNLLIKALEGFTETSLTGRKLLPNLNLNIRCGNSLISGKSLEDKAQEDLFSNKEKFQKDIKVLIELKEKFRNAKEDKDKEDLLKEVYIHEEKINSYLHKDLKNYFKNIEDVKPFNFEVAFCDIFKDGGFDCVIGNPPYVKEYTSTDIFNDVKKTDLKKYYKGKMDIWYIFACKSIDLLKENGFHSFIAQNNWITSSGASLFRNKVLIDSIILSFFDFNTFKVFKEAGIQTMVYVLQKNSKIKKYNTEYFKIIDNYLEEDELIKYLNNRVDNHKISHFKATINPVELIDKTIDFTDSNINEVLEKIKLKANYKFTDKNVAQGIVSPQESVIESHISKLRHLKVKKGDGIFVLSKNELLKLRLNKLEKEIIKPYYTSDNLFRYYGNKRNNCFIIYSDIKVRKNIKRFPNIKKHLEKFKSIITSDFAPFGLHRARDKSFFEGEKIISIRKTARQCFTYTNFPCYVSQTYFILKPNDINLKYLTGILNSTLIYFWLKHKGKKQGDLLQIDKEPILDLPIYKVEPINKKNKSMQDKLIQLVNDILNLNKSPEKNKIKIEAKDREIDDLVYELYGITDKERKVIEGK
jgi:adenine-specific DNA-methyltransferase